MDIFFNINPLGMEGLGSTLTSLIRNCSNHKELSLLFLCSELKAKDKNNIHQLLQNESFKGAVEFIDFNVRKLFGHLKSLHGDWTTYGRLLIPNIAKSNIALYLDSDLVIKADVLELKTFTTNKIISAVYGCPVHQALENNFFIQKLNWHSDTGYFNSGVLLFNISAWKTSNVEQKLKEISAKYPNEFLSADQTLLNAACEGNFGHLPKKFNQLWYPSKPQPANTDNTIIHFVGSPKPWDLFGKITHARYSAWKIYDTPFWEKQYGKITTDKLKRTWKISRSIVKNVMLKLLKK